MAELKTTLDELDRLAAEKVMGMVWSSIKINASIFEGWSEPGREYQRLHTPWQPTRNIEQAWECLEKLSAEGWKATIYDGDQAKSCVVFKYADSFHEYGKLAPEAIVRACLKAKGVEIG